MSAVRSPASAWSPSPILEVMAHGSTGSIFRSYNLLMDQARKLEDLEALVLIHQDAEIVDPTSCEGPRGAERSGRGDPRLRRRRRRAQHRLVGRLGDLGLFTHRYEEFGGGEFPALAWDARSSRRTPSRRGRHHRRLRDGALALGDREPPLRRVARPAPRLRLRLLPAGPRGGQEGRHRRPPGRPPPLARPDQRPRHLDRGPHARRGEVGGPDARVGAAPTTGRPAPAAPRPRPPPSGRSPCRPASTAMPGSTCRRQREQMEEEATRLREAKDRFAAELQAERANKPPREGRLRRLIKEPRRTIVPDGGVDRVGTVGIDRAGDVVTKDAEPDRADAHRVPPAGRADGQPGRGARPGRCWTRLGLRLGGRLAPRRRPYPAATREDRGTTRPTRARPHRAWRRVQAGSL